MGNQETAWPYTIDRPVASAPDPTPETTNLTQTLADLGQPRSSMETTTGDMNTAEKQEDKDAADNKENKAKNKLKEIIDMQPPQSVTVSAYDQSAVIGNINILNGNIVDARGHNADYQHVPVQQPPESVIVLAHDQAVVNINVDSLNGNIVGARGNNTGYQNVSVSQHKPDPQRALDHPRDYGRCDSHRPNYPRQ